MQVNHIMSILKILTDLCQKTKNKKHFCKYCLQCFSSKRNLIEQKETCLKINGKLTVTFFFFYVGFLSRTFTNHRTAGEGGGCFFNSSLPLPSASHTLRH